MYTLREWGAWGGAEESHSLRREAVLEAGGATADTSVSFARWQQGEQAVSGVGMVF